MFSDRTALDRQPNALARALSEARRQGRVVLDLTVSNPTTAGFAYPEARILTALSDRRSLTYTPVPFGLDETRHAVARMYEESGVSVDPARIVLTASTSEAYTFLFKLLCNVGDEVLVPAPSYPLFEVLARFEGVKLVPYALAYDGTWHIDLPTAAAAKTSRTRAILLVSPNNPTGSYVKPEEFEKLAELGLPLVCDEVFASFELGTGDERRATVLETKRAPLVFALNGLSKMAALPQMKLGWIVVGGAGAAETVEALERLEILADAFLSVGTPVQLAAKELLAGRHETARAIRSRLRTNLAFVRAKVEGTALTLLDLEGGWYATLRLPAVESEEAWTLLFLEQDGVYVHPGHFFDFPGEAYVVLSLLTPEGAFREGVLRLVARVESHVRACEQPALTSR